MGYRIARLKDGEYKTDPPDLTLEEALGQWLELSEEHDLLDGSWCITKYTDEQFPVAVFDFVATDIYFYREETCGLD